MPHQHAEPDPNVAVPAAVRRAAAKAEALHKAQPGAKNPTPDPAPAANNGNSDADSRPIGELVPAAVPPGTTRFIDDANTSALAARQAANNPPPAAQPDPAAQPARPVTAEEWEHRYNSENGRYRSAMSALAESNRRAEQLQALLASVGTPPASNPQGNGSATPKELQAASLLTPKEVEEYGTEFVDVVKRAAREVYDPIINDLQTKVNAAQQTVSRTATAFEQDARSQMLQLLDGQLPQWRVLNEEQRFYDWLQLPDPFSGDIRHALLKRAFAANKGQIVLNFFQGFLADEAASAPPAQTGAVPAAGALPGQAAGKVPLASLAAPGRATAAAGNSPAVEKPIIKRSEIAQFYSLSNRGHWNGNEVEKKRLEQMIFEAQRDGRIVDG